MFHQKKKSNTNELPEEILRKIAVEHVDNLEDFEAFREVCHTWRSATKEVKFCPSKNRQLPWLMLVDPPNSSHRRFYSLSKRMYRKIKVPELDDTDFDDHRRYFSSNGWLISVSSLNRNVTLFDPFSGEVIKLPSFPLEYTIKDGWKKHYYRYFFNKIVISSRPSCCNDYAVAVMFRSDTLIADQLAFLEPGQHKWTIPNLDFDLAWVDDVCYFEGEFYACDGFVDLGGTIARVMAFGSQITMRKPRIVAVMECEPLKNLNLYLVVVETKLLLIQRDLSLDKEGVVRKYWTVSFEIFVVNVNNGDIKQVLSLGNRVIFLGQNSGFSIEASSDTRGFIPNSIYFTDDYRVLFPANTRQDRGIDMGIYSLCQGKVIEQFYEGPSQFCFVTPPLWLELPHC